MLQTMECGLHELDQFDVPAHTLCKHCCVLTTVCSGMYHACANFRNVHYITVLMSKLCCVLPGVTDNEVCNVRQNPQCTNSVV